MAVVEGAEGSAPGRVLGASSRHRSELLMAAVSLVDVLVVSAAVLVAWHMRLSLGIWPRTVETGPSLAAGAGPWIVAAWTLVLLTQGAYSFRSFGAGPDEFRRVVLGSMLTAGSVGLFCYLVQAPLSRGFVLLTFFLGTPMLVAERYAVRRILHTLRNHGHFMRRVVAVGGPAGVNELVAILQRERYVGYQVLGACIPDGITVHPGSLSVPLLGSVEKTRRICDELGADTVMVARGGYGSPDELRRIAWDLEESDLNLVVVPSLTDVAGPRIHMRPVAGLPLLHVEGPRADEAGGLAKRLFDIAVAGATLALLSPLMLLVALAIKAQDGGPVFFRQPRVGWRGSRFAMVKFRSMVVDAERRLEEVRHLNDCDGVLFKMRHDPRITPVGRWLRKYSIDELPQLLNVLKGEMSLVGPRPPLASEVDRYDDHMHRRLLVRPGMTGLWQVSGRSELSWQESIRLDLYYVDNWSMVTDLVILAKTVKAVVASAGAY